MGRPRRLAVIPTSHSALEPKPSKQEANADRPCNPGPRNAFGTADLAKEIFTGTCHSSAQLTRRPASSRLYWPFICQACDFMDTVAASAQLRWCSTREPSSCDLRVPSRRHDNNGDELSGISSRLWRLNPPPLPLTSFAFCSDLHHLGIPRAAYAPEAPGALKNFAREACSKCRP